MIKDNNLTLEDLSNISGLTLRTLRYYIQEGILQGPDTRGKFSRYSQHHLDRLELIKRFKNLRLPIQEIRHLLENMNPEEISQIKQYQDILKYTLDDFFSEKITPEPQKEGASALEYILNLERGLESIKPFSKAVSTPPLSPQSPSQSLSQNVSPQLPNPLPSSQETWARTILQDGIELNIRHPNNAEEQKKIQQLIEFAQRLFR